MRIVKTKYFRVYETKTHYLTDKEIPKRFNPTTHKKLNGVLKASIPNFAAFEHAVAVHNLPNGRAPKDKQLRTKHQSPDFTTFCNAYSPYSYFDQWRIKRAILTDNITKLFNSYQTTNRKLEHLFTKRMLKESSIKDQLRLIKPKTDYNRVYYYKKDDLYLFNIANMPPDIKYNRLLTYKAINLKQNGIKNIETLDYRIALHNLPCPNPHIDKRLAHSYTSFNDFCANYTPEHPDDISQLTLSLQRDASPQGVHDVYKFELMKKLTPAQQTQARQFVHRILSTKPKRLKPIVAEFQLPNSPKATIRANKYNLTLTSSQHSHYYENETYEQALEHFARTYGSQANDQPDWELLENETYEVIEDD